MRHSIRIPLLAIGAVLGYGFAFHSMSHHRHHRDAWERHVADVCVGAAQNVKGEQGKTERPTPKTESTEP
jgi:hypothetical protein